MKTLLKKLFTYIFLIVPKLKVFFKLPIGYYKTSIEYAKSTGLHSIYKTLYEEEGIKRKPPMHLELKTHNAFKPPCLGILEYSYENFAVTLSNCRIWTINGNIITNNHRLLFDVSREFSMKPQEHSIFKAYRFPKTKKIKGTSTILTSHGGAVNYFHWMFDTLPRLYLFQKGGYSFDDVDNILIGAKNRTFQKESLEILNVPKEKIIYLNDSAHFRTEKLILPSLPGLSGNMPKWTVDFLRQSFLKDEFYQSAKFSENIYISRSDAKYRFVTNEDEVINILQKYNFEVIVPGKLSFKEQINLFYNAKVIISPHGAALTNLVFCKPQTKVLELFAPEFVNQCYWTVASHCNLEYWYHVGEKQVQQKIEKTLKNIQIDKNQFSTLLYKLLETT